MGLHSQRVFPALQVVLDGVVIGCVEREGWDILASEL